MTPTAKCMYCGEAIYKVKDHWGSLAGHWKHTEPDRWHCAPSGDRGYHVADNADDPNAKVVQFQVVADLRKVEEEFLTKAYKVAESFVGEKPRKTCKPTTVLVLAMNITGRKFRLEE